MTLVLTQITKSGITMAADSAITQIRGNGIVEVDEQGWTKLLKVPRIRAAISYWGMIGAITKQQFDIWLQKVIDEGEYTDLSSFANYLAKKLNEACGGKPLQDGYDIGIHVAGFMPWRDGVNRPTFLHVHNGHGEIRLNAKYDTAGKLVSIDPKWVSESRTLFVENQDFPNLKDDLQKNIDDLEVGHITRNGDFFLYAVFQDYIMAALAFIHKSPNFRIPKDPQKLASQKGFLHIILETMIRLYRSSNQSHIVGGSVSSLAIGPNGYVQ